MLARENGARSLELPIATDRVLGGSAPAAPDGLRSILSAFTRGTRPQISSVPERSSRLRHEEALHVVAERSVHRPDVPAPEEDHVHE